MSKLTLTEIFQAIDNLDAKAGKKGLMLLCHISEYEMCLRLCNRTLDTNMHRVQFIFPVSPASRNPEHQAEKLELAICELNAFLDTYKGNEVEELKAEIQKKKEWIADAEKRLDKAMKEAANG